MFGPETYDVILDETRSTHHLVGSAWGLVALLAIACVCISAVGSLA